VLELVTLWVCVRALLLESRRLLKVMGEGSGVDIEPDEQTKLADDTMTLPGVLAAGVRTTCYYMAFIGNRPYWTQS